MHYKPHVELPMEDGSGFFDPQRVVMVLSDKGGSRIVLDSNAQILVSLPSEQVAKKLWRFTNRANNNDFFNEQHVSAIIPEGQGCKLLFSQGGFLEVPLSANAMIEGLRFANAQRNTTAGPA